MLEKTMKQVITKKINEWLETIDNKEVKNAISKDLIITGGCFTSMILNEKINDFDCYFRTKESTLKVANYYANLWNDNKDSHIDVIEDDECRIKMYLKGGGIAGDPKEVRSDEELGTNTYKTITELDENEAEKIIEKEKKEHFPVFISSNAITLSNEIQIIVRFYGNPNDIHETFDFIHTKAFYDIKDNKIIIPAEVYETTINKTLKYTGSKYPVCSIFRLRKFINRGWKINAGQMLKICIQISKLDLMDINVLEDQLIGVDSLYFINLVNQFREQKEKNSNFELTSNYIISIIDKIF